MEQEMTYEQEWEFDIREQCWYCNIQLYYGGTFTHAYRVKGITAQQQHMLDGQPIQ